MNGYIDGELYVLWDNNCYELKKRVYGLKNSLQFWHEKLESTFESLHLCSQSLASVRSSL